MNSGEEMETGEGCWTKLSCSITSLPREDSLGSEEGQEPQIWVLVCKRAVDQGLGEESGRSILMEARGNCEVAMRTLVTQKRDVTADLREWVPEGCVVWAAG